jgi:DNA-binding transcriptional LysR family regulator
MSDSPVNPKVRSQTRGGRNLTLSRQRSEVTERFFRSRLRLTHLRLLVAIDELGQLKKVADRLSVTPPAISKQVTELEEALEMPILTRVGNRLEFTEAGKLLTRRARQVMRELDRARGEVDRLRQGSIGTIGLGATPTIAPFLLPILVTYLRDHAPGTSIRLTEGPFSTLSPMLQNSTLDLVLARNVRHVTPDEFEARRVLSDPLAVICGTHHPLASKKRLLWKDLSGFPWVLPLRSSSTYEPLEHLMQAHGLSLPVGSIESIALSVNVTLLQNSLHLGLGSLGYVQRYLSQNTLSILPLSTSGFESEIRVIWRRDDENPLVRLLIEAILERGILI